MLENTDGTIRETVNIVYTRCKKNHNTICVKHQYTPANTNNANTTCAHLLTTRGKDDSKGRKCIGYRTGSCLSN